MPHTFWRASLATGLAALRRRAKDLDPALRRALEAGAPDSIVFELIRDDADMRRLALTMSVVNGGHLTCWMAFSNDPRWCNTFRERGIPMVEAQIALSSGVLRIEGAAYPERKGLGPVSLGNQHLLTLRGVDPNAKGEVQPGQATAPAYVQLVTAPDVALQSEDVAALRVSWAPLREQVRKLSGKVTLEVEASAWPVLAEIVQAAGAVAVRTLEAVCAGGIVDSAVLRPAAPPAADRGGESKPKFDRLRAAGIFGAPVFRFEDVDVVGFRITLPAPKIESLQALVEPLNFHRKVPGMVTDFTWRVATSTVMVELLHYGRMKSESPQEPLRPEDYMSQHELLVRLLVGKVDDDGSQAREASMFVPAIFVDNPVSKVVGRESQGMPKELAEFCIASAKGDFCPLEMDGRLPGQAVQPLAEVVRVRLAEGGDPGKRHKLLDLSYPSVRGQPEEKLERVDLDTVLDDLVFGGSRFRQSDFGEREFRRSFARRAMSDGFNGFRSVQVTPVDDRALPSAWIHGQVTVTNFKALFPHGVARMTFSEGPGKADDPWNALCGILGREEISLPSGNWYRLKMSMDLRIRSSLDW
jgi:hypothetical protein